LAYWLGGTRAEKPAAYDLASPVRFVSKDDPPIFFFHGETDALVPLASPQLMIKALTTAGVPAELHTVAKVGHIAAFYDPQALAAAVKFLDMHLKGDNPAPASPAPRLPNAPEPAASASGNP
jgi:dipeptidyl aminopeptidase/acylaminoacyl peptidase